MLGFEKVADWWDEQKKISEQALDQFVDEHPNWFGIVVAGTTATAMELGKGFVDILRVGEGVKEGGLGYAKDALRVVSLIGPVARIGRLGLARVAPNASGGICAWVTAAKALRQTGTKHFAKVADLFKVAGHSAAPTSMAEMIGLLKQVGARVRDLGNPASVNGLKQLVGQNPNGVIMFGVVWNNPLKQIIPGKFNSGHALYAFRDMFGRFRIADRSGEIVATLAELGKKYSGIGNASFQGAAVLVENSAIVHGTNLASILALEVKSVMLTNEKTVSTEIERLRSKTKPGVLRFDPKKR